MPHQAWAARHRTSSLNRATAFTIVELLVIIAILSVLLAIALPALRAARTAAQDAASLSNIQQSARTIMATALEDQGRIPTASLGGSLVFGSQPSVSMVLPDGSELFFSWFAHVDSWPFVLSSRGNEVEETWYSPSNSGRIPGMLRQSDYILTQAAITDPAFWSDSGAQTPDLLRPVRFEEFEHPSSKGLLVERTPTLIVRHYRMEPQLVARPIAFADGSADRRALIDARPGMPNQMQGGFSQPIATTRHGCLGYDF